jgi:hypothetical protein
MGWSANTNGAGVVPSEQEARRLEWAYAVMRKRALEAEKAKGKAKGAKNGTTNDRAMSTASIPRPRRREVTAPVRAALNPSALVPEGPAAAPSVQSGEMAPSWEVTPPVATETPADGMAAARDAEFPSETRATTPPASDTAGAAALKRLMTRRRLAAWRTTHPGLGRSHRAASSGNPSATYVVGRAALPTPFPSSFPHPMAVHATPAPRPPPAPVQ